MISRDVHQCATWDLLANLLEIEITIESEDKSSQCYQKLCQWRMYVDEVSRLDVFTGEFTEVYLVETINKWGSLELSSK